MPQFFGSLSDFRVENLLIADEELVYRVVPVGVEVLGQVPVFRFADEVIIE